MRLAAEVLLTAAAVVILACSVGLLRADRPEDRLHFAGPLVVAVPWLMALATTLDQGFGPAAMKSVFIASAFAVFSPILSHAILRSIAVSNANERKGRGGVVP